MSGTDDDIDGILALFQLYEQKMYHITYAILHDSHLAEDAVMDAFVKMLEHNYRIEDPKSDASKRLVIAVTRSAVAVTQYFSAEGGCLELSPISCSIDLSKGPGLSEEEAYDPGNLKTLSIHYSDGTVYDMALLAGSEKG